MEESFTIKTIQHNGGRHAIRVRNSDGWISATDIAKIESKRAPLIGWLISLETTELAGKLLSNDAAYWIADVKSSNGIWIHPSIARYLGRWLSSDIEAEIDRVFPEYSSLNNSARDAEQTSKQNTVQNASSIDEYIATEGALSNLMINIGELSDREVSPQSSALRQFKTKRYINRVDMAKLKGIKMVFVSIITLQNVDYLHVDYTSDIITSLDLIYALYDVKPFILAFRKASSSLQMEAFRRYLDCVYSNFLCVSAFRQLPAMYKYTFEIWRDFEEFDFIRSKVFCRHIIAMDNTVNQLREDVRQLKTDNNKHVHYLSWTPA
jgi:hypothetical protein